MGFCGGVGFTLAMILMSGIRERLELLDVPESFRDTALSVVKSGRAISFTGATARMRNSLGLPELGNVPMNDIQKILELSGFTSLKFLGKSKE